MKLCRDKSSMNIYFNDTAIPVTPLTIGLREEESPVTQYSMRTQDIRELMKPITITDNHQT